ncbi:chorismate-binding protein [Actinoplanes sp. NPDC051411]|uniref:chorismate-binding protein n=1 Tax=Actinoplanes sp. NPDC051411 TaxID=3155522 RepID=UPI00342574B9
MVHETDAVDHSPEPPLGRPPGAPAACQARHVALSVFQWHASEGGDGAEPLAEFLTDNGLSVRNIGRSASQVHPVVDSRVCGAALYVSAAAGCVMAGGRPGAPSPVPAVPDIYAVVYGHGYAPAHRNVSDIRDRRFDLGRWTPSWTPDEHAGAVEAVRDAIGRGDVYVVNLVGHASAAYRGDPAAALRRVAGLPGAKYGGVLSGDGWALATASPETLVEVRDGLVVTRPIKGTRPATAVGREDLLGSAKERAEHIMIVDLERNDLARLSGTGPVRVEELFGVREWAGLWQAESVVAAPVAGDLSLPALLRALCPGGSVTGAPKPAALAEIARLEPVGRGVSMGAVGWLGHDHLDLALTIRTVAVDGQRVHAWAGGGITIDSDPHEEVAEAAAKAAPIREALAG